MAAGETRRRPGPPKGVPRVRYTPEQTAERRAAVATLAGEGLNDREIGRRIGVSKTTVATDRRLLGIPPKSQGRPALSPLPEKRRCEICGDWFQPTREHVKQGGGRFCPKPECLAQDPKRREASRAFATGLNIAREEAVAKAKAADPELLTRDEAAALLGVTPTSIDSYLRRGYLPAVRLDDIPGQPATLVRRADVEQHRRDWRAGDTSGLRRSWLDPEHVVHRNRARGITEIDARRHNLPIAEMEVLYRDRVERRRKLFEKQRGRPKAGGPPKYHFEWAAGFDHWREELSRQREENLRLGLAEQAPTDQDAYRAVAELDWQAHPERWDRNDYPPAPSDPDAMHPKWEKTAIARVRKAVKALQIAETENP